MYDKVEISRHSCQLRKALHGYKGYVSMYACMPLQDSIYKYGVYK